MTVIETHRQNHSGAAARSVLLEGPSGDRIRAAVHDHGEGSPVVFLHGLVGLNEHWDDVVPRITEGGCRCLRLQIPLLDLRGEDCSVDGVTVMTAQFLRALRAEEGRAPVVVGNSFGGHIACRLAMDEPELVRGIVLTGASGLHERPLAETSRFREIQIKPSRAWVAEKIGELFFDRSKVRPEDLERAHAELNARGGAKAMVRLSRSARKNNLAGRLAEVRCPALLIWGREDIVTPPEAADEFAAGIPDARIEWLDRCGHVPMIEHPAAFSSFIVDFVRGLDGADAGK